MKNNSPDTPIFKFLDVLVVLKTQLAIVGFLTVFFGGVAFVIYTFDVGLYVFSLGSSDIIFFLVLGFLALASYFVWLFIFAVAVLPLVKHSTVLSSLGKASTKQNRRFNLLLWPKKFDEFFSREIILLGWVFFVGLILIAAFRIWFFQDYFFLVTIFLNILMMAFSVYFWFITEPSLISMTEVQHPVSVRAQQVMRAVAVALFFLFPLLPVVLFSKEIGVAQIRVIMSESGVRIEQASIFIEADRAQAIEKTIKMLDPKFVGDVASCVKWCMVSPIDVLYYGPGDTVILRVRNSTSNVTFTMPKSAITITKKRNLQLTK